MATEILIKACCRQRGRSRRHNRTSILRPSSFHPELAVSALFWSKPRNSEHPRGRPRRNLGGRRPQAETYLFNPQCRRTYRHHEQHVPTRSRLHVSDSLMRSRLSRCCDNPKLQYSGRRLDLTPTVVLLICHGATRKVIHFELTRERRATPLPCHLRALSTYQRAGASNGGSEAATRVKVAGKAVGFIPWPGTVRRQETERSWMNSLKEICPKKIWDHTQEIFGRVLEAK